MAEFTKTVKVIGRICNSVCDCSECPIGKAKDGLELLCLPFMCRYPEKTEELVMKWAEDHPVMTNHRKFEEVFGMNLFKLLPDATGADIVKWLKEEYKGEKNG